MDVLKDSKELIYTNNQVTEICSYIANGGALTDYASKNNVDYNDLYQWLISDNERREKLRQANIARSEWCKETILNELKSIATLNVADCYDHNGDPLPMDKLPTSLKKSIQSIKKVIKSDDRGETITTEIKFFDKIKAINLLGKELGMFSNKVEVSGKVSLESLIGESFDE